MDAEFRAIIDLIKKAMQLKIPKLLIRTDCKPIYEYTIGIGLHKMRFELIDLFAEMAELMSIHQGIELQWMRREKNTVADRISRKARKSGEGVEKKVEDLDLRIQKSFVKQIVKRNTYIMLECKTCRERKSANQYPRKKVNGKRRSCFDCLSKLNAIHK